MTRATTLSRLASGASLMAVLCALTAAPAGASDTESAALQTLEVIVSVPVEAGEPPAFEVVETDLAGVVELVTAGTGDVIEWNDHARLTHIPSEAAYADQWGEQHAGVELAWDVTQGDRDIVVAVVDSGVRPSADLGDRLLPGASFIEGGDPNVDELGHGSAVALVVAAAHDGTGVAGLCPRCSILPVQVADANGAVPWAAAADGIVWAVDNGADIINLSFGAGTSPSVVEQAVAYAEAQGVVVVAAAGNTGTSDLFYPAAFESTVSVAAHTSSTERYDWSTHGEFVDYTAPGCANGVDGPDTIRCGTSFAAPWVSGLTGLLLAGDGDLVPSSVRARLDLAAEPASWVRAGWIDAGGLFKGTSAPAFTDVAPTAYYAEPVAWLVDQQITTGTSPTTYDPDAPVTRGQLAAFLYRLAADDEPTLAGTTAFTDVAPTAYYAEPVAWLVDQEITTGTSPTTYDPDAPVTRGQLAAFLYRLAADDEPTLAGTTAFTDVAPTAYYAEPVAWLVDQQITTGTSPTTYDPDAPVTRGQLAAFLYRLAA